MWAEGRLKLGPWLWPRLDNDTVHLWPRAQVTSGQTRPDGQLDLAPGEQQHTGIDQVILATGYKVDLRRIGLRRKGNTLNNLAVKNGFPQLDPHSKPAFPDST